ncbi:MAG: hypothetical protein ABJC26_01265, partial [Gemmatimonadaceae bacterium]
EDNVFILNTDFFFAMIITIGWLELADDQVGRWFGAGAFAAHLGVYLFSGLLFSFQMHKGYADEMRSFVKSYLADKNSLAITDWGTGVALTFFGRPEAKTTLLQEPLFQQVYDVEAPATANPNLAAAHQLYLIDRWKPLPLSEFFRTDDSIREQYRIHSIRQIAERELNVHCELLFEKTNKYYRCTLNPPLTVP